MKRQPARVLEQADLCRVLRHLQTTRTPVRDQVIVLLSFKAGLRACEIAGLDWGLVLKSTGHISDALPVSRHIAK
jgi:integrase/recombinase XerD